MIEILIAIGVIGLILIVWMFTLYSKQAENRDLKRISDIQTLRQAMAVIKSNNGFYDRSLCEAGAVSACAGKDGSVLKTLLPQLANFNDPATTSVSCVKPETCKAGSCNYAFTTLSADTYEILFYLEKGVNGFSESGCYAATPQGIRKN
jgi:type II secretory pathway pseudopilin PulG